MEGSINNYIRMDSARLKQHPCNECPHKPHCSANADECDQYNGYLSKGRVNLRQSKRPYQLIRLVRPRGSAGIKHKGICLDKRTNSWITKSPTIPRVYIGCYPNIDVALLAQKKWMEINMPALTT